MRAFVVVFALGVTGLVACGGVDPLPPPPPPPPAMPAAPTASSAPTDDTPAATPPAPVLLVAGAPAPEPTGPAPQVRIVTPTRGQVIADAKVADFIVKLDIKNWPVAPASGRVHLGLDGRAVRTVSDPKAPLKLGALQGSGPALAEGRHVLTAVLARGSDETLKGKDAFASTEFYVGRTAAASGDAKEPYLVVTKPDGAYEDDDADHVLVDFLAIGTTSSAGSQAGQAKQTVALRLDGPGIDGVLTATATRTVPYYLENLRAGTYTLALEILGPDGKPLANGPPGATVSRTLTIKRSARTVDPKRSNDGDAGVASPVDTSTLDAGHADSGRDGGLPRIPPHPFKTKPVIEKPKPPAPPVKKR